MSRIGKKPIAVPQGVEVTMNGNVATVKGPKGELSQEIHPWVTIEINNGEITTTVKDQENHRQKAMWGTVSALLKVMILGVTEGYEIKLEINGVGYQWQVSGQKLTVKAGYSHPVIVEIPEGVKAVAEGNVLTLTSIDKQLLGEIAANIRKIRKPEPYKGKGIKYMDEQIKRKQGKQAAGAGA
jgi:large subunit ribosomal protein L6